MILETFTLPIQMDNGRLYPMVCRMLPWVPERFILEAFNRRDVKMDGIRVNRDAAMIPGAEIKVYLSGDSPTCKPEILYEDQGLIILFKPIGISCESDPKGGLTVGEWLYRAHRDRLSEPPVPCHRLDNPTDGLLILAKDESSKNAMELAFRERKVHKRYICLVRGTPEPAQACLNAFLLKDAEHARVHVLDRPVAGALSAYTEYRVITPGGGFPSGDRTPHGTHSPDSRADGAHRSSPAGR